MKWILLLFVFVHIPEMNSTERVENRKRKASSETDFEKCLICQDDLDDTLHRVNLRGLPTLIENARRRKDELFDRIRPFLGKSSDLLSKNPVCHKQCKRDYIHCYAEEYKDAKCAKLALSNKTQVAGTEPIVIDRRAKTDFKTCCFICCRSRSAKGDRNLKPVTTQERQKSIHMKAKELKEEKLLVDIIGHGEDCIGMVAQGFRYHKQCMDNFMNRKPSATDDSVSQSLHDYCFNILVQDISDKLLKDGTAFYLNKLRDRYRTLLMERGVDGALQYRSNRLKVRLKRHFQDAIQVVEQKGTPSLVCSSTLTVANMCSEMQRLRKEFDVNQLQYCSDSSDSDASDRPGIQYNSFTSAKHMRAQMKDKEQSVQALSFDTYLHYASYDTLGCPYIYPCN